MTSGTITLSLVSSKKEIISVETGMPRLYGDRGKIAKIVLEELKYCVRFF